jgi:hypothetical protein
MATQLAERPSRLERRDASELNEPSKIERVGEKIAGNIGGNKNPVNQIANVKNVAKNVFKKPVSLNFICMVTVAITLDLFSLIPGVSILVSILYNVIFIPWFIFSGVKFNMKKIGSMGASSILEYLPFISFLPFMTINVIYSYYSN